jgi:hypothetical protein
MRIDYSLPEASKYIGYVDAPFRYGYRHLYNFGMCIYVENMLGISLLSVHEKIVELTLALFEIIPGIGHCIAAVDRAYNHRDIKVVHLTAQDSYELGKEQGIILKDEIQFLLTKGLNIYTTSMIRQGIDPLAKAKALEVNIPEEYKKEMHGLADGSGCSYDDILIANTIVDTMNLFGCSLYAISHEPDAPTNQKTREIATNYFASQSRRISTDVDESFKRYDSLEAEDFSTETSSLIKALQGVNYYDTIQAITFDTDTCDISLATAGGWAANRQHTNFSGKDLFQKDQVIHNKSRFTSQRVTKLARTMDWPMPILGPETVVIVRPAYNGKNATAIVGWPAMIGALSGNNEDGTSLSISVVPSTKQQGIPNQFIFRQILEKASSIKEAVDIVQASKSSSSMNLVVAAVDGIARMELDPARKTTGAAIITYGKEVS